MTAYDLPIRRSEHYLRAGLRRRWLAGALAIVVITAAATPSHAQTAPKPYDQDLFRLAENLGGIHYLGAICARNDGQAWRQHMQALIDAEGATPRRRADLAKRFNLGYRNYSRTYRTCSETAKAALTRFINDATRLTDRILANAPPTN